MEVEEVVSCCELHRECGLPVSRIYLEVCASYSFRDNACDCEHARVQQLRMCLFPASDQSPGDAVSVSR